MSQDETQSLTGYLEGGRSLLIRASATYGRSLSAMEYWWLGVGLAAITLAELNEKPYAVGRLEQLVDRLGYKGIKEDWLQRFIDELAEMDAEGLLWPLYQRSADGPIVPTGVAVAPTFDAEAGYFLALAHIGVALLVNREEQAQVESLAGAIAEMIECGLQPGHVATILGVLKPDPTETEAE